METTAAPATTGLSPVAVRRAVRVVLVVGGLIAVAWLLGVLFGAGNARADDAPRPHHTGPLGASVSHAGPHRAVLATSAPAAPTADLGAAVSGVADRATGTVRHTLAAVPPVVHAATATVARVAPTAAPALAPVVHAADATTAAVVATAQHAVTHADAVVHGVAAVLPTVPLPTVTPTSGISENLPAPRAGAAPSAAVAPTPAMAADPGHAAPRTVRTVPADVSTDRRSIPVAATGAAGGHAPDVTTGDAPTPAAPAPALPAAPTAPATGGSAPHAPLGVVAAGAARTSAPTSTVCSRPVDRAPADRHLTDLADRPD